MKSVRLIVEASIQNGEGIHLPKKDGKSNTFYLADDEADTFESLGMIEIVDVDVNPTKIKNLASANEEISIILSEAGIKTVMDLGNAAIKDLVKAGINQTIAKQIKKEAEKVLLKE